MNPLRVIGARAFPRRGEPFWTAPFGARGARLASLLTVLAMAVLILARLDHYGVWDDEANTALFARGVWRTGDTAGQLGTNIVAYRDGLELDRELRNRVVAPLPYFLEAPFVRDGDSAWWARIPFALCGIAAVALGLHWLLRSGVSRRTFALFALAIVGNVALILTCRQARYYALAILLSVVIAYAYAHRDRGWRMVGLLTGAAALLAGTNYLCFAGMGAALGVDYLIWGRRTARLSAVQLAVTIGAPLAVGVSLVLIWQPFAMIAQHAHKTPLDHAMMWLRTLRDLNNAEYGAGLLMLAAPVLYLRTRDPLLLRLPLALAVATLAVTVFSPQPAGPGMADIRYSCFLIPLCIVLGIRALEAIRLPSALALVLALVAFQTTLLHRPLERLWPSGGYVLPVRSTLAAYLGELADPPVSAYRLAAEWLEAHARQGESAVVVPDFATYPLMFHVPKVVYAWQFSEAKAAQYPGLSTIHIRGRLDPDWVIVFGGGYQLDGMLAARRDQYELAVELPATGVDQSRAEVFWHRFDAGSAYDPRAPLTIWRKRAPASTATL